MKAVIAWWNTSLTPSAVNDEPSDDVRRAALKVILILLEDNEVCALGLAEVSARDMTFISNELGNKYNFYSFNESYGKTRFDLGFISKASRTKQLGFSYEIHYDETWTYALGVRVNVSIDDDPMTIFLSHWPSRLRKAVKCPDRTVYGTELRKVLKVIMEFDDKAKIILAGDYNDEPFDEPIAFFLKASRDRSRVLKYKSFLYNPFWRKLGAHKAHDKKEPENWAVGTYYHSSGRETKWYTFDQILFSKEFLVSKGWRLIESDVAVLVPEGYLEMVRSRNMRFDHLPVKAAIER